jgi:hypothetical protein
MTYLAFCEWLAATPASQTIQDVTWIIPAVQSVHILAIAGLMMSIVAVDLRLIGLMRWSPSLRTFETIALPWFWVALAVLLSTGAILVIGEPERELRNVIFLSKMAMVCLIALLAAIFQLRVRRDEHAWSGSVARTRAASALGAASLLLVLAIIICGRWIAYAGGIDG